MQAYVSVTVKHYITPQQQTEHSEQYLIRNVK